MTTAIRVLVVDDEPSIRNSLVEFLEDCQFDVLAADSAESALALITRVPIDVTIVDIRLPDLDGDSLIAEAHRLRPPMRYLIHTGSVAYKLPDTLKAVGIAAEHVLTKPQMNLTVFKDAILTLTASGP